MAIHYGFQDKFMLSLNLTKHRNKHFPNAPYLRSRVARQRCHLAAESLKASGLHRLDHFTDKNLGNVSPRRLQQLAPVSGHPWAPTGKMEFPLCFVTAINQTSPCTDWKTVQRKKKVSAKTLILQVILTSHQTLKTFF